MVLRVWRKYWIHLLSSLIFFILTIQLILAILLYTSSQGTGQNDQSSKSLVASIVVDEYEPSNNRRNQQTNLEQKLSQVITPSELKSTVEQSSQLAVTLNRNQFDFEPVCNVTEKFAISAISRATSQKCREELVNVSCSSQRKTLYPHRLTSSCPVKDPEKEVAKPGNIFVGQPQIKIAFLLTVNGRAVRQVKRLIRNVYRPSHIYYIHVDSRQDYLFRELLKLETKYSNIKLMRSRLSTIWGGASLLQMLLNSISDLLKLDTGNNTWDYFINLSESDFPIKSISNLEKFLAVNKGKNFVKFHGQDLKRFIAKQGLDKTFHECDTHMWRVADRQLPVGVRFDGGSDWVVLSRQFCEFINLQENELINGLKQVFKYTLLPAETFFHTALINSHFCQSVVDNNLRVTNWRRKHGCKCQYKHIVDWCGCSPNDFKLEDWTRLLSTESKPFYFARKFEPVINQAIINKLENWIGEKQTYEESNEKYWQNEYHFKDIMVNVDDAKISIYRALATTAISEIQKLCYSFDQSDSDFNNIKEVHFFFEKDVFQGILINLFANFGNSLRKFSEVEIFFSPKTHFELNYENILSGKLLTFEVCSDFDPKEQVFRNFGCILGPFSKITAMHRWTKSHLNFNVQFVWIDPTNTVAEISNVDINSDNTKDDVLILTETATITHPLVPGVWRLVILHNSSRLAETRFMITPLLYFNSSEITKSQVKFVNAGRGQYNIAYNGELDGSIWLNKNDYDKKLAFRNSRKYGKELVAWIQEVSAQFWHFKDFCFINNEECANKTLTKSCHMTNWSSLGLDPKSFL